MHTVYGVQFDRTVMMNVFCLLFPFLSVFASFVLKLWYQVHTNSGLTCPLEELTVLACRTGLRPWQWPPGSGLFAASNGTAFLPRYFPGASPSLF